MKFSMTGQEKGDYVCVCCVVVLHWVLAFLYVFIVLLYCIGFGRFCMFLLCCCIVLGFVVSVCFCCVVVLYWVLAFLYVFVVLYCIGIYPRILDFDIYSLSRSVSPAEILSLLCLTILHQHNAHHPYTHHTQIWTLLDFNEF